MEENDELEIQVFQIISAVGTARSCYIEAIHAARERDYEQAEELLAKGDKNFAEGHDVHLERVQLLPACWLCMQRIS